MSKDLVTIKGDEIYCDSSVVAKKFGVRHDTFSKTVQKMLSDYPDLRPIGDVAVNHDAEEKYYTENRNYKGQDYTAYMMNRPFFSLVSMRFRNKDAREWQRKFNSAFYMMEKRLIQVETNQSDQSWISTRQQGKIARINETDVIKDFVEYATNQGSKNAKFYYKHITNATYKALGLMAQGRPKIRDEMNIYHIAELMLAERLAQDKLKQYMELGRHYKDIYKSVSDDLINYSNALRITG